MAEKSIVVTNMNHILNLFGSFDENIKLIQDELNVTVITRGTDIKITGNEDNVKKAYICINSLLKIAEIESKKCRKGCAWCRQKRLVQQHAANLPEQKHQRKANQTVYKFIIQQFMHCLRLQSSCAADCNADKILPYRDRILLRCGHCLQYG